MNVAQIYASANNNLPLVGNIFYNALSNCRGVLNAVLGANFITHIFGNGIRISNQGKIGYTFRFYYHNNNSVPTARKIRDVLLIELQHVSYSMGYAIRWNLRVKVNPATQMVLVMLIF